MNVEFYGTTQDTSVSHAAVVPARVTSANKQEQADTLLCMREGVYVTHLLRVEHLEQGGGRVPPSHGHAQLVDLVEQQDTGTAAGLLD